MSFTLLTRTEVINMEAALNDGAAFPRPDYNLQVREFILTDGVNMFDAYKGQLTEYLNGDDVKTAVVPTGDINGSNRVFTVPDYYIPGSLMVILNGLQMQPVSGFTEDAPYNQFTFVSVAPEPGDVPDWILAIYVKQKSI